jgi:hypothetical protein
MTLESRNRRISTTDPFSRIKGGVDELQQMRRQIQESIEPTTILGKFRQAANRVHPDLGKLFGADSVDEVTASLRDSVLSIYAGMREMLRDGHDLQQTHTRIRDLVDAVNADPDNTDLVLQLRDMLRLKAEESLQLERDAETEALIEGVLKAENPNDPAGSIRDNVVDEALRLLSVLEPTVDTISAVLRASVKAYDSQVGVYSTFLHTGAALKTLNRASDNLVGAAMLKVNAFNTMAGSLAISIKAAELATEAAEIGKQLDRTMNQSKLAALAHQANGLLERTTQALPEPSSKKDK